MPACRFHYGAQRAGFIPTTRAAGSNGIAGTIWAAARLKKTKDRSTDGEQCDGICGRYNDTAPQAISGAAVANAKPYCIGPTTVDESNRAAARSRPGRIRTCDYTVMSG